MLSKKVKHHSKRSGHYKKTKHRTSNKRFKRSKRNKLNKRQTTKKHKRGGAVTRTFENVLTVLASGAIGVNAIKSMRNNKINGRRLFGPLIKVIYDENRQVLIGVSSQDDTTTPADTTFTIPVFIESRPKSSFSLQGQSRESEKADKLIQSYSGDNLERIQFYLNDLIKEKRDNQRIQYTQQVINDVVLESNHFIRTANRYPKSLDNSLDYEMQFNKGDPLVLWREALY